MRRVSVVIVLATLLALFAAGCAMLKQPEWSENYALEGECTVEQMNDGSMYSSGKTLPPVYVRGQKPDDSRFNNAIITFKEPKAIKKIALRRRPDDTVPADVNVEAMVDGNWKVVKEVRGAIKEDINIQVSVVTDKIKIRAQRATRTSEGKTGFAASSATGGRGQRSQIERVLREPVKFAEIEIYGLKGKEAES